MIELVGVDGLQDGDVVHHAGEPWEHLGEFGSTVAVAGEAEARAEHGGVGADLSGALTDHVATPADVWNGVTDPDSMRALRLSHLGLIGEQRFGEGDLGWMATLPMPVTLEHFVAKVERTLGRTPLVLGDPDMQLRRIGWCTGAAQSYFDAAIDAGADVFLTGEVSEYVTHTAAESGVAFVAAGHHATERYGIQALGAHLSEEFDIEHLFIDIHNPV